MSRAPDSPVKKAAAVAAAAGFLVLLALSAAGVGVPATNDCVSGFVDYDTGMWTRTDPYGFQSLSNALSRVQAQESRTQYWESAWAQAQLLTPALAQTQLRVQGLESRTSAWDAASASAHGPGILTVNGVPWGSGTNGAVTLAVAGSATDDVARALGVYAYSPTNPPPVQSPTRLFDPASESRWIDGTGGVWVVTYEPTEALQITFLPGFRDSMNNTPPESVAVYPGSGGAFEWVDDGGGRVVSAFASQAFWSGPDTVPSTLVPVQNAYGTAVVDRVYVAVTSRYDGLVLESRLAGFSPRSLYDPQSGTLVVCGSSNISVYTITKMPDPARWAISFSQDFGFDDGTFHGPPAVTEFPFSADGYTGAVVDQGGGYGIRFSVYDDTLAAVWFSSDDETNEIPQTAGNFIGGQGTFTITNLYVATTSLLYTAASSAEISPKLDRDSGTSTNQTVVGPLTFSPTNAAVAAGQVAYDSDTRCWNFGVGNGVTWNGAEEALTHVHNDTSGVFTNGFVISYSGGIGASPGIRARLFAADSGPESILGVATEDIAVGSEGKVTHRGYVRGIPADGSLYGESGWTNGQSLYCNPVTNGYITGWRPQAPRRSIFIGSVANNHHVNGMIYVKPHGGQKFVDLDDVDGTPLTTSGQFAVWDQTRQVFDFTANTNLFATPASAAAAAVAASAGKLDRQNGVVTGLTVHAGLTFANANITNRVDGIGITSNLVVQRLAVNAAPGTTYDIEAPGIRGSTYVSAGSLGFITGGLVLNPSGLSPIGVLAKGYFTFKETTNAGGAQTAMINSGDGATYKNGKVSLAADGRVELLIETNRVTIGNASNLVVTPQGVVMQCQTGGVCATFYGGTATVANLSVNGTLTLNGLPLESSKGASVPIVNVQTSAVTVVNVTPTQAIYMVTLSTPTTVTNSLPALNCTTNLAWELWVNFADWASTSNIVWDARFDWSEGVPDITVTGLYRFACSSACGTRITARQTFPTRYQWEQQLIGVSGNNWGNYGGQYQIISSSATSGVAFVQRSCPNIPVLVRICYYYGGTWTNTTMDVGYSDHAPSVTAVASALSLSVSSGVYGSRTAYLPAIPNSQPKTWYTRVYFNRPPSGSMTLTPCYSRPANELERSAYAAGIVMP